MNTEQYLRDFRASVSRCIDRDHRNITILNALIGALLASIFIGLVWWMLLVWSDPAPACGPQSTTVCVGDYSVVDSELRK